MARWIVLVLATTVAWSGFLHNVADLSVDIVARDWRRPSAWAAIGRSVASRRWANPTMLTLSGWATGNASRRLLR